MYFYYVYVLQPTLKQTHASRSDFGRNQRCSCCLRPRVSRNQYDIQLAGRNTAMLQPIEKDLSIRYKNKVTVHPFDAADFDSHAAFYGELSPKPDVVICVFGLLGDQAESARNWSACKQVLDANFTGAVSVLNVVANDFENRKQGVIVGISSVAGERGRQSNYLYGSAKAGFTAYLSGMRNRLVPAGVHVVTIKPGFINTRMTAGLKLPKPLT
ncbi:MAG: SDR family NAD(P)-dependent oxidoreductase, partial [Bacteroidia bacterium]|nr:SDR family NAD(P)-dependent oxidoreductase [Bacteroidia bacterium]